MSEQQARTRREFIRQVGAVAAAGTVAAGGEQTAAQTTIAAKNRVIGANDRINVGFIGCGGRMNTHIRRVMERNKERGDVQAVAVNDIWDKRKQRAREATGVDERSVHAGLKAHALQRRCWSQRCRAGPSGPAIIR